MRKPNYTIGRGRLFVGFDGESGERYLGNSPGFSFTPDGDTVQYVDSEDGVLVVTDIVDISNSDAMSMTLDDISTENMALYFGTEGGKVVAGQSGAKAINAHAGRLYEVSNGPLTGLQILYKGQPLSIGNNFRVHAAMGMIEVLKRPLDLYEGQKLDIIFQSGTISRQQLGTKTRSIKASLRYIEDNMTGSNRMFFWSRALIRPAEKIDFKTQEWRTLEFAITPLSTVSVIDSGLVDNYGYGVFDNTTFDSDFGQVAPGSPVDDYGVIPNGR